MKKLNLFLPFMSLLGIILGCGGVAEKKPSWQKAKIIAENVDHPQALTTDGDFVYYVTGGTIASLNEGTSGVWKMPLNGGQPVQIFKGHSINKDHVNLPEGFFLITDEKYVYWSGGAIWRTPKDAGESQKISGGMPTDYALDETKIYWHNFGGEHAPPMPIYSVEKSGGEPKTVTEPVITSGIVLDKELMFWAQSDGIYKIPKNGGEKSKIYTPSEKQNVSGLIADTDNFYFTEGNGRNALFKISKNGGEAVKIAPEINHVHKFFVDETDIYFIKNEGSFGTSLNKVSKQGGEVVKIDSGYLANFAVGKDKIFVADVANIYELAK